MTPDEVRAAVRSWPELLAARFETEALVWLADADARLAAQIVAETLEDVLAGLDVALDFSDAMTAKLEAILNYVHTMEEQHPMTDTTPNEKREPPDRSVPAIYRMIQADAEREGVPLGGWAGEMFVPDPNRATPNRKPKPASPFPPPPWSEHWTPGCDE